MHGLRVNVYHGPKGVHGVGATHNWVVPGFLLIVTGHYFSPHGSAVCASGVGDPDPMAALFEGLSAAEARGHKRLVLGNVRISRLGCNVPSNIAVPPRFHPGLDDLSVLPTLHHLRLVPSHGLSWK